MQQFVSVNLSLPLLSLSAAVMCPSPPQPKSNSKVCSLSYDSDSGRKIIDDIPSSGYGPLLTPDYLPPFDEVSLLMNYLLLLLKISISCTCTLLMQ